MTATAARYANWKAPAQDGELLIWPPPDQLLRETRENAKLLSSADRVRIGGIPLSHLRRDLRAWLGHADPHKLIVATGHQTELYHPGVWVKDILINAVASRLEGTAIHFAVDTDQPKHLAVRWPGETIPLNDDPTAGTAEWSGLLETPTPVHVASIERSLRAASADWTFEPLLGEVLSSLKQASLDQSRLSASITAAQHALDWSLGLRHHAMLASPLFSSREYLVFVHHVLSRASQFAVDYNAALAGYRSEVGITSATRPMPDLRNTPDEVEVPFWMDDLSNSSRVRAVVRRRSSEWALVIDGDEFKLDQARDGRTTADLLGDWLRRKQLRLSPRALTLTTFLRLLVVDQFVHGIGGGRYDQVTDRLLASHFGIEPPKFAVTTATMFFPGAVGRTRVCMPCVAEEGHRLKHGLLGNAKKDILSAIQSLPRRSIQRSLAFHNMHSALSAAATENPLLVEWASRYEAARRLEKQEQVLFDRELFYAMQSRDRLEGMIRAFAEQFEQSPV